MSEVYETILKAKTKGDKLLFRLIDPDKYDDKNVLESFEGKEPDVYLVGGSLLTTGNLEECISDLKSKLDKPVVIFPGGSAQISENANALLLLSLLSGRNADYLIGEHVKSAFKLSQMRLELIPTGYILIDGGSATSVSYMSNTIPIPRHKQDIAMSTALAGEQLGMKMIYLEAGSGAQRPVPLETIKRVRSALKVPLVVGGGITDGLESYYNSGADIVVVGTAFEQKQQIN